jgi:hypothetical protein
MRIFPMSEELADSMTNRSYVISAAALRASHLTIDSSTMRAEFFLDSGATTHVVGDPALLHDFVLQKAVLNGVGGTAEWPARARCDGRRRHCDMPRVRAHALCSGGAQLAVPQSFCSRGSNLQPR